MGNECSVPVASVMTAGTPMWLPWTHKRRSLCVGEGAATASGMYPLRPVLSVVQVPSSPPNMLELPTSGLAQINSAFTSVADQPYSPSTRPSGRRRTGGFRCRLLQRWWA